jgi:thiamine-phosphate pyrophosphorylase
MKSLSECRLYAFVDTAYLHGRRPEAVAQELCEGGADLIQLRAKNASQEEVRRMAEVILPVTRGAGVGLVINDHFDVAVEIGAEYCHLGQEDFFGAGWKHTVELPLGERQGNSSQKRPVESRGRRTGIGLSTHSPEQAGRALDARPDYIAIGPVYATGTKPQAKPVTLEYVRWAAANVKIPWFAIGGITLENLDEVLGAGADRICVVSAILNSKDVAGACRSFRERLTIH